MIGEHLDRLARWLVRMETYEIVVAPAIADLQHEGPLGKWPRIRAYAATWRTIALALSGEIAEDVWIVVRGWSVGPAVGIALLTMFGFTSLLLLPLTIQFSNSMPWHHAAVLIPLWYPTFTGWAISVAVVPAAAMLATQTARRARRAAIFLGVLIGITLFLTNRVAEQSASNLRRELLMAQALAKGDPELLRRPLWELRKGFREELDLLEEQNIAARERFSSRHSSEALARDANALGATVLGLTSCALFGAAWPRRSRRWIVALTGAVFIMHALFDAGLDFLYIRNIYSGETIWWARSTLFFLTACLLTLRSSRMGVEPRT